MLKKYLFTLAGLSLSSGLFAAPKYPNYKSHEQVLFRSATIPKDGPRITDEHGVQQYRIPSLTATADGKLIANIVCRLSTSGDHAKSTTFFAVSNDQGKTWDYIRHNTDFKNISKRPKGSFPLTERTQESQVVWHPQTKQYIATFLTQSSVWFTTSKDLKVWSQAKQAVSGKDFVGCWPSPATLTVEKDGTLVFAITGKRKKKRFAALAWTKDLKKFEVSDAMPCEGNETAVAPLGKGRYFVSTRIKPHRLNMIYDRNSKTWSKTWPMKEAYWRCEVDVIADKGTLYMSTPTKNRSRGKIFKSTDEGKSWTVAAEVCNDYFAYSALVKLKNGDIGLLAERAFAKGKTLADIVFHKIKIK